MGRATASLGLPPASQRKDARAKRAKKTISKDIPGLLQSYPRARNGVDTSELIGNPVFEPIPQGHTTNSTVSSKGASRTPTVRVHCADTLQAAAEFHASSKTSHRKPPRIGILNMASPLRPGGGFLNGATSQEESLCMRTTLYPALKEEFYRLPEVGGIYTSDVLVFRSHDAEASDLPKQDRFFVDVISASMHRLPDVEEDEDGDKRYTSVKDRAAAEAKIRAVMTIAKQKKVKQLVLGAFGCGAYGNPVGEVAAAFRKVLHRDPDSENSELREQWQGLDIVFAIKEKWMADQFASHLNVSVEGIKDTQSTDSECDEEEEASDELQQRIAQLESQISSARSQILRDRLESMVQRLKLDS